MKLKMIAIALLALGGCGQQDRAANANDAAPTAPSAPVAPSPPSATAEPATPAPPKPSERKVLIEPNGPIDPKSVEAAGQVVQHYGALIEQGRFAEAAKAWGNADAASTFARQLQARGLKHLEIGDFGEPEGAAGSIYVTMPVVFYQDPKRSPATVTLRRVNDVDGSTEAQRRWHIERIEWGKA